MIKVGIWSVGLALSALGVGLLSRNLLGWPSTGQLADLWGLVPLFLGVELLVAGFRAKRQAAAGNPPRIRLHGGALAGLMALVLIAAIANIGVTPGGPGMVELWWTDGFGLGPRHSAQFKTGFSAGAGVPELVMPVVVEAPPGQWSIVGTDGLEVSLDGELTVYAATADAARQAIAGSRAQVSIEGDHMLVTIVVPGYDPASPVSAVRPVGKGTVLIPRHLAVVCHSSLADFDVTGFEGNVDIDTSTGRVNARQVKGDLTARTATGNIVAEDISGTADLNSSTGYLEIARVAGAVTADTNTGWVRVTDPGAGLDLHLSTGGCTVKASSPVAGDWRIRTTTGFIQVSFPSSSDVDITARTNTGALSTNLGLGVVTAGIRKSLTGTLGSGIYRMDLEASTGAVTVEGVGE